jgi:ligand-binding sensor domain-containing protein
MMKTLVGLFLIITSTQVLSQSSWVVYDTSNSPLPYSTILDIEIEPSGNLWVATLSNGVYFFDGTNWENYTSSNSELPANSSCHVIKATGNDIWIGTGHGLVKKTGNDWTYYNQIAETVTTIDIDSEGNLWLGFYVPPSTEGGGLIKFDGQNFTIFDHNNSCIPCNYIETIKVDHNDDIWFSCPESDIGVIKFDGNDCNTYNSLNGQLLWDNIVDVERGQDNNNMWVASTLGVSIFDGIGWHSFTNNELCIDTYIWDLELSPYSDLWMVSYNTDNGLVKYKADSSCVLLNETNTGESLNALYNVEYNDGIVWVADFGRVMKYTREVGVEENSLLANLKMHTTSNILNFECNCSLQEFDYMIVSINGRVEQTGVLKEFIDIRYLSQGIYFIHIYNTNQHATFKLPKTN